jgi:hypothetical protein
MLAAARGAARVVRVPGVAGVCGSVPPGGVRRVTCPTGSSVGGQMSYVAWRVSLRVGALACAPISGSTAHGGS